MFLIAKWLGMSKKKKNDWPRIANLRRTYDANNKSVFVSVVFVLVLSDQSLTGIVVGLTLCNNYYYKKIILLR